MIPIDLREHGTSTLADTGCDSAPPTASLANGLLPYPPAETGQALPHTVHTFSPPGSHTAIENLPSSAPTRHTNSITRELGTSWGMHVDKHGTRH